VKVEAVANVFFDISDRSFIISPVPRLRTTNITANTATFNWSPLKDAYGYQVSYKLKKAAAWIALPEQQDTTLRVSRLYADSLYEWRVRAVFGDHDGEYATATFRTAKRPPCQSIYDNPVNDLLSQAAEIRVNTRINGIVEDSGDVDFYRFKVDTGSIVALVLNDLPADYDLSLHDKAGNQLAASVQKGKRREAIARQLAAGVYYAKVYPKTPLYEAGRCYELTIISIPMPKDRNRSLAAAPQPATMMASKHTTEENKAVTVFPNPAGNEISVRYPALKKMAHIRIYDLQGRVVKQQLSSQPNTRLNIGALPPGAYILHIKEDDRESRVKILRQ
jgi:hypothetical protein